MSMIITAITGSTVIVLVELLMGGLFLRRHSTIEFPQEMDTSFFRFFTNTRMRVFMILHTIFLILVFIFSLIQIW